MRAHYQRMAAERVKETVHDVMHAKFVVADDCVFCGSYNLCHSGEMNAENVIEFQDAGLADMFTTFADQLVDRYPAATN